jgi:O-antigen/teichoic acid export membrane protein
MNTVAEANGVLRRARYPWRRLRTDELIKSSLYIFVASATTAGLGFVFWVVNSRLYTAAEIGTATSLLSATSLISYLSLFGMNSTVIRYLPSSVDRSRDINAGLAVSLGLGLLLSLGFVALLPWIAPDLAWLGGSPGLALAFCVLAAFTGANLFTDSVFIAIRSAKMNALIDGLLQGGSKLVLTLAFAVLGSFGIVLASGLAATVAVGCSLIVLGFLVRYRPAVRLDWRSVRAMAGFSAAAYAGSLFNLAPVLVLPLIVLNVLGAQDAGYFFIAFQIANLLYAVAYAICQSLFAEGSHDDAGLRVLAARAAKILACAIVPAALVIAAAGGPILSIFGAGYRAAGGSTLALLALSSITVASYCWVGTLLKCSGRLGTYIWMNAAYGLTIVGVSLWCAPLGLVWVAVAWLCGNAAATVVGGSVLLAGRRRR